MRDIPYGMLRYQWEDTVRFWNSKKEEDRERVGLDRRQKQKFTHSTGSKSFARVINEEEVTSNSSVGKVKLFDITHRKNDGSPITHETGEIMEQLLEKRVEYEATVSSNDLYDVNDIDNRVITEVMSPKRYGRVRGQQLFITPTKYFGSSSSQYTPSQSHASQAEVICLKQQLDQVDDKFTRFKAETEVSIKKWEEEFKGREAMHQAKFDDIQVQLRNVMSMLERNQGHNPPS